MCCDFVGRVNRKTRPMEDPSSQSARSAPPILWVLWTGDNPLTERRAASVAEMRKHSRMQVNLVTPKNLPSILQSYLLPSLHPAYEYLTTTHRSDYLRLFLMYHVGGAYSDIKPSKTDWREKLDQLNGDPTKSFLSQRVKGGSVITPTLPEARHSKKTWENMTTLGAFIARPKCPFVSKMLSRVNSILTEKLDRLKKFPGGFARNVRFVKGDKGYPMGWHEILGDVGHKLQMTQDFRSLAVIVPCGTFLKEGLDCVEYRGVEGDNIASAWFSISKNRRQCEQELKRFNCRVIESWGAQLPTYWVALAHLANVLLKLTKCGNKHTLGICLKHIAAEVMLTHAEGMKARLSKKGVTISPDGGILVVSNRGRYALLTKLCALLHEYKGKKDKFDPGVLVSSL